MEHEGWNLEENYNLSTNRRSIRPQDELVELLWRDGQVILNSQTHREQNQTQTQKQNLHQENLRSNIFLDDQETVSWIQYPPDEDPFETENFSSRFLAPLERPASEEIKPEADPNPPSPQVMLPPKFRSSSGNKEQYSVTTVGPSHCGSNQSHNDLDASTSHDQSITTDRKRKQIMDNDETLSHSDAVGKESNKRSGSAQRSRAAEVHNLSERRRRDRINERIKALQELIPHCSKTDKASILDEAIDYLKSLQLQLQVMWMGSGMAAAPMMFPGGVRPPQLIHQMQMPVHLPRFPVMDRSTIQNNPGLVCHNPVFSNRFGRYIGGVPHMPDGSQPVDMLRFGSQTVQGGQQPSASTKTMDSRPFGPLN